ncbi:MAG: hypothetical protein LBI56_02430 [Puniceicoccales bacterium]|jgi:hypothetical protein|nr:hypothetical protein [Puniceicoccales bacterium]
MSHEGNSSLSNSSPQSKIDGKGLLERTCEGAYWNADSINSDISSVDIKWSSFAPIARVGLPESKSALQVLLQHGPYSFDYNGQCTARGQSDADKRFCAIAEEYLKKMLNQCSIVLGAKKKIAAAEVNEKSENEKIEKATKKRTEATKKIKEAEKEVKEAEKEKLNASKKRKEAGKKIEKANKEKLNASKKIKKADKKLEKAKKKFTAANEVVRDAYGDMVNSWKETEEPHGELKNVYESEKKSWGVTTLQGYAEYKNAEKEVKEAEKEKLNASKKREEAGEKLEKAKRELEEACGERKKATEEIENANKNLTKAWQKKCEAVKEVSEVEKYSTFLADLIKMYGPKEHMPDQNSIKSVVQSEEYLFTSIFSSLVQKLDEAKNVDDLLEIVRLKSFLVPVKDGRSAVSAPEVIEKIVLGYFPKNITNEQREDILRLHKEATLFLGVVKAKAAKLLGSIDSGPSAGNANQEEKSLRMLIFGLTQIINCTYDSSTSRAIFAFFHCKEEE